MTADIVDFYLNTPLPRPEYMKVNCKFIPPDIMAEFSLDSYVDDGSVLFEVTKGVHGLPQAGLLAQQRLV